MSNSKLPRRFKSHAAVKHPDGRGHQSWLPMVCGHCGLHVNAAVVSIVDWDGGALTRWLLCPVCIRGSVFTDGVGFIPGPQFGPEVQGLPDDVAAVYQEARRCMSVNAWTAAEMVCRKILMHVAVDKCQARAGEKFTAYVDALEAAGYTTPPMKSWVDMIRQNANQSNHELPQPDQSRAQSTVEFTAQLLRLVYEMDYLAKQNLGEGTQQ